MNSSGTPIALALRAWFVVEVLFGVGAILTIAFFPAETRTNFAWEIQPVVMAAVLGAFYVATAPSLLLPLFARRWEMIRVIILPAALFTSAELITTFLHLDRFFLGTVPFYAWLSSYLLPPPIYIGFYFWQQRRARESGAPASTQPLAAALRKGLIYAGVALAVVAFLLFLFPNFLIAVAPWRMTPLTARALLSWFIALAALMLSMARENDRARVLIGVPELILIAPVATFQILRYADQVNWASGALWIGFGFALVASALGLFLARGNWREALS